MEGSPSAVTDEDFFFFFFFLVGVDGDCDPSFGFFFFFFLVAAPSELLGDNSSFSDFMAKQLE